MQSSIDNTVNALPASNLYSKAVIRNQKSQIFTRFIGQLEVKPCEQPKLLLGEFTRDHPAKGFSIQLDPSPEPIEAIVTQITTLGTDQHYRLILHIANYGDKTISAEVWSM